jgi:hypothetical protein
MAAVATCGRQRSSAAQGEVECNVINLKDYSHSLPVGMAFARGADNTTLSPSSLRGRILGDHGIPAKEDPGCKAG